jgi:hypothetical protein
VFEFQLVELLFVEFREIVNWGFLEQKLMDCCVFVRACCSLSLLLHVWLRLW